MAKVVWESPRARFLVREYDLPGPNRIDGTYTMPYGRPKTVAGYLTKEQAVTTAENLAAQNSDCLYDVVEL